MGWIGWWYGSTLVLAISSPADNRNRKPFKTRSESRRQDVRVPVLGAGGGLRGNAARQIEDVFLTHINSDFTGAGGGMFFFFFIPLSPSFFPFLLF